MIIVYTSGSTALGGTLGTPATMQVLQLVLLRAGDVPRRRGHDRRHGRSASGPSALAPRAASGTSAAQPTSRPASSSPAQPAINGNIGSLGFNPLGSITISLNGVGTQVVGVAFAWTITGVVGQEVSRTVVPEPGTGVLLLGSLAGLAFGARRLRR